MSDRPTKEQLDTYAREFSKSATLRYFGVTLSFPNAERIRATFPVKSEHRGGLGSEAVNGGVLAAIFDLVIGSCSALVDPTRRSATVHLSMNFEQPVHGDIVTAEGWVDRAGGSTLFASAHILDGAGRVCARAQGVVRMSRMKWENGSSPAIN